MGDTGNMGDTLPTVCSIRVAQQAQSLGVTYNNDSTTPLPRLNHGRICWTQLMLIGFAKLTKLPLSMFGRATAASSNCISKSLFQAEFGNMPDTVAS